MAELVRTSWSALNKQPQAAPKKTKKQNITKTQKPTKTTTTTTTTTTTKTKKKEKKRKEEEAEKQKKEKKVGPNSGRRSVGNSWGTVNAILGLKYDQNHPNGAVSSEQKRTKANKSQNVQNITSLYILKNNSLSFSMLLHQSDVWPRSRFRITASTRPQCWCQWNNR